MWLYAKNMDKDKTNMDMLIQNSNIQRQQKACCTT
jgi:hypothetical protein